MTSNKYDTQRIQQQRGQIYEPSKEGCNAKESGKSKDCKSQYQKMSDEQKRHHNKRCVERRKKLGIKNNSDYQKEWKATNREKQNQYVRRSVAKRKQIDPAFRILCNLRNRLKDIMKSSIKGGSNQASSLVGCSTKQLTAHLESQFTKRMSWENYGKYWQVDHILPCASFDHSAESQVKQCWHWTNLRPLKASDNLAKSDSITLPQMNLMLSF